jgi:ABC-type polysaccharide/polyol phosphate export permease
VRIGSRVQGPPHWMDGPTSRPTPESAVQRTARLFSGTELELLVELIRAEFKSSDQGTALGALWSMASPLVALIVMYTVFHRHFGGDVPAYPLYLLLGIVLVSFFRSTTSDLMGLLPRQRGLLVNTTVPPLTVFMAAASTNVSKLVGQLLLCAGLSGFYGLLTLRGLLAFVPLLVAFVALALGVSLILCTIRMFFKDAEHLWRLGSRLLFFGTPVFYTLDSMSPQTRTFLYWINPLTPFLIAFREDMMGLGVAGWDTFIYSVMLGVVALAVGYWAFVLRERQAVEVA